MNSYDNPYDSRRTLRSRQTAQVVPGYCQVVVYADEWQPASADNRLLLHSVQSPLGLLTYIILITKRSHPHRGING
jgi:hypothetical protein